MELRSVELFEKQFLAKGYYCNEKANDASVNEHIRLNLYISINDICNAKCDFCNVHRTDSNKANFNLLKLEKVLKELKNKDRLNRIAITGGETFLNINLLNSLIDCIANTIENPFITINTNGSMLHKIKDIKNIDKISGIHISRHHYEDFKNDEIFGIKTATLSDIEKINNEYSNSLIRLNCNLIKGYIDNYDEVKRYLDMAIKSSVFRVGFVGLMELNNFCKDNYINFKDFNFDKYMLKTETLYDTNICECENYLYCSEQMGRIIEVYFRQVKSLNCKYCRQLSYTCDNKLLTGFNNNSIL